MKFSDQVSARLDEFRAKHALSERRGAINLLVFQLVYVVLLLATMVLCLFVDQGTRLLLYLLLVGGILAIIIVALVFNLRGKYRVSTWLTAPCIILGPWLSILLDPSVLNGDFVPLIYVAMSIQLCSILLREKHTIVISIIQFTAVVALILLTPALKAINWPSLLTFIVFTSVVGVLYGYTNKHQLTQIEQQRNQLLEDEARLRELSVRDPLTGLYNRRYMEETFDREIQRAVRKEQPLSVIMADIDGFKNINDTIGHVLGDKALVKASDFLMNSIRSSDVACRFGGDEFCLILPDCSLEEGIRRANALCCGIEALHGEKDEGFERFTVSFGVASMPDDGITREAILGAADRALYCSKCTGKNRVSGTQLLKN